MEAALEASIAIAAFSIVLAACVTGISLEVANAALSQTAQVSSMYAMQVAYQLALMNLDIPENWASCNLTYFLDSLPPSNYSFIRISTKCFTVTPSGEAVLLWAKSAVRGVEHPSPFLGKAFLSIPLRDGSLVVVECTVG